MIQIFTTSTCAYCKNVKKYFDLKGIEYEVLDMDEEPKYRKALGLITNALTVPVTVNMVNGVPERVVIGWKPAELAELVGAMK